MKNQPLKPWIKGNESITPNNFFSNLLKISNTDSIYIWERIENHIKII